MKPVLHACIQARESVWRIVRGECVQETLDPDCVPLAALSGRHVFHGGCTGQFFDTIQVTGGDDPVWGRDIEEELMLDVTLGKLVNNKHLSGSEGFLPCRISESMKHVARGAACAPSAAPENWSA